MFIAFYRTGKFALQNFWRNLWLSLMTVSVLVLTLLSINVLLVLNAVTDRAIAYVEQRVDVSVYFYETVTEDQLTSVVAYLRALSQVKDVQVVTADEALLRFQTQHQGDEEILQSLNEYGGNPFGPTLVVQANQVEDFDFIISALDHPDYEEWIREKDFSNYQEIIDTIRGSTDRVRWFGYGLSGLFLLITALIVFNTVRMGIFIHREEIGIMRLVGASSWFIRAPFLLEAVWYSFLATVVAGALLYPILLQVEPKVDAYFGNASGLIAHFIQNGLWIFGGQFVFLSLLNMLATSVAMRRYLKI
jgi:cell division transport system permease protein